MASKPVRRYAPLNPTRVTVSDGFWAPRRKTNRQVTLPAEYRHLLDTGREEAL